jgi:hypothetical protein
MNKTKTIPKTTLLDEARIIGYMEGFSDGRIEMIRELTKFRLLPKGWKKIYNKKTEGNYFIK